MRDDQLEANQFGLKQKKDQWNYSRKKLSGGGREVKTIFQS